MSEMETGIREWKDLSSERLCLRRLREGDAAAIFAYRSLPEVERYQGWESFTLENAEELVAKQLNVVPNTPGSWMQLAITERQSGLLIGDCGLHFVGEETEQVELGVTLSPSHQGKGLATEALRSVLGYVFDTLNKHRAVAILDDRNRTSARLMERLGFRKEAHYIEYMWFKDEWCSDFLFALLQREWQAQREKPASHEAGNLLSRLLSRQCSQ